MKGLFRAVFVVLLSGLALASNGLVEGWTRYTNPRFGASAEIPPEFVAGEEPANGDGRRFDHMRVKADVTVYGSLNVESETLKERLTTLVGYAEADGWDVSYKRVGAGFIVQSGSREGRIFYEKIIAACDGEAFNAVRLEYPDAMRASFDAIVTRVAGSLLHDPQGGCG